MGSRAIERRRWRQGLVGHGAARRLGSVAMRWAKKVSQANGACGYLGTVAPTPNIVAARAISAGADLRAAVGKTAADADEIGRDAHDGHRRTLVACGRFEGSMAECSGGLWRHVPGSGAAMTAVDSAVADGRTCGRRCRAGAGWGEVKESRLASALGGMGWGALGSRAIEKRQVLVGHDAARRWVSVGILWAAQVSRANGAAWWFGHGCVSAGHRSGP